MFVTTSGDMCRCYPMFHELYYKANTLSAGRFMAIPTYYYNAETFQYKKHMIKNGLYIIIYIKSKRNIHTHAYVRTHTRTHTHTRVRTRTHAYARVRTYARTPPRLPARPPAHTHTPTLSSRVMYNVFQKWYVF